MTKQLAFSNNYFTAELIESVDDLVIKNYAIIVNLDDNPINVGDGGIIASHKSYLLRNWQIKNKINRAVIISFNFDPAKVNPELNNYCASNWDNNQKRYPKDSTKWQYKILRSPIEKINNLELNCWYLPKNEASSIHKEHQFKEIHTQIYGLGIMNKFKENTADSLYQRMYMAPGFTHDPFYGENGEYSWHQYEAVTDSIWMAIMEY